MAVHAAVRTLGARRSSREHPASVYSWRCPCMQAPFREPAGGRVPALRHDSCPAAPGCLQAGCRAAGGDPEARHSGA
eukprot:11608056-Alexandrium_andersonii.AAC.1